MLYNPPLLLEYIISLALGISLLCIVPKEDRQDALGTALVVSITMFFIAIDLWLNFDKSELGYQYISQIPLISEYNLTFSLGVDGISLLFLLLTVFIMPICIFAASSVEKDT